MKWVYTGVVLTSPPRPISKISKCNSSFAPGLLHFTRTGGNRQYLGKHSTKIQ